MMLVPLACEMQVCWEGTHDFDARLVTEYLWTDMKRTGCMK